MTQFAASPALPLLAFLIAYPCSANDKWLERDLYECTDYASATFCDKGCGKLEPEVKLRVRVDSQHNKVLVQTVFSKQSTPFNRIFNDCKVFDDQNWDCSTKPARDIVSLVTMKIETVMMVNGIYTAVPDASLRELSKPKCAK